MEAFMILLTANAITMLPLQSLDARVELDTTHGHAINVIANNPSL